MGTPITLDDGIGLNHYIRKALGRIGESGINLLPHFFSRDTTPRNGEKRNDKGEPMNVKTRSGHELGYLVGMSWFPANKFTEAELKFIDYSDRESKAVHRGLDRKAGGVYQEHPYDMIKNHIQIATHVGLPLDYKRIISRLRHDDLEHYQRVKDLLMELQSARAKVSMSSIYYGNEPSEIAELRGQIKKAREEYIESAYQKQGLFIKGLLKLGINPSEASRLDTGGAIALGEVDWLTRYIEENLFYRSMFLLHRRLSLDDYVTEGIATPFQIFLMKKLGLQDGSQLEPLEYFLSKISGKLDDRIVLTQETKPRFNAAQAKEMKKLFYKHSWLREAYGDRIDFRGKPLERTELLDHQYKNFIVLHYLGMALSDTGQKIGREVINERDRQPYNFSLLQWIVTARERLLKETRNKLYDLKRSYESELSRKAIEQATKEEEQMASGYPLRSRIITGQGPISYCTIYGRQLWETREKTKYGKVKNYGHVLSFLNLLEEFQHPKRNITDIVKGGFELFYIQGLKSSLRFDITPKP